MHKLLLNKLELTFTIQPNGPILIKSGVESGADPTLPDMNFVRGLHPTKGTSTIYLPGSSLKGVLRSHAERLVRTVGRDCCDPLGGDACDQRPVFRARHYEPDGPTAYREVCTICRMFGHTVLASRVMVPDAYPETPITTLPIRQMVAIDRRSGGSVNTFTMEVATEGVFTVRVLLSNFERWQVGLLALVLRDLSRGQVGVGFGKSRGLGRVTLNYTNLALIYPGRQVLDNANAVVYGVAELDQTLRLGLAEQYGFAPAFWPAEDDINIEHATLNDKWGQIEVTITGQTQIECVLESLATDWARYAGAQHHA